MLGEFHEGAWCVHLKELVGSLGIVVLIVEMGGHMRMRQLAWDWASAL